MPSEPRTLTARWLFPVERPPLPGGTITIQGERILAVEKAGSRAADVDLGNVAILPGFVNAHTHLDLSDALGQCPPGPDFTGWLRAVISHRRRQTPDDVAKAIDMGVSQCVRYGTTLVGDIAAGGMSWERLAQAPLRAVVFHELLGLSVQRAQEAQARALAWLEAHPGSTTCRPGLSPHAPYSVRASLLDDIAALSRRHGQRGVPVAIHLAETEQEMELLRARRGPFKDFLTELGAWEPAAMVNDVREVVNACKAPDTLLVHGNYLPANLDLGTRTLVYCPRTHAAFGHKPHPFRAFLARGARVALASDSLASNPDLDMLAEARFLHAKFPDVPGETVLRMATLHGAEALTWAAETGSLAANKAADLVVLPLPDTEPADPHALVLKSSLRIKEAYFRGKPTRAPTDVRSESCHGNIFPPQ